MKPEGTQTELAPGGAQTKQTAERAKRTYTRPALRVYGSVRSLTQGGNGSGADGGSNPNMTMVSEPVAKENVVRIGTHPFGIGLYLFDYKPGFREIFGAGRQFGVMADEVETVMPQAVAMQADGYKAVDYTLLGIVHGAQ
jgi:hypothetical protein